VDYAFGYPPNVLRAKLAFVWPIRRPEMKRADIDKWAKIAAGRSSAITDPKKKPIRIIDLPGVRALEDRLLLSGRNSGYHEDIVALVTRELFGVGHFELRFKVPEDYQELSSFDVRKHVELERLLLIHESQFETGDNLTDGETVEVMSRLGFDFTDDVGRPLRCTKLMSRPVEAAAKGIMGRVPDRDAIEIERFEADLEKARDAFLAKKRRA
jgi:hypothetical protein